MNETFSLWGTNLEGSVTAPNRHPSLPLDPLLWRVLLILLVSGAGWGFQKWIYGIGFIPSSSMEGILLVGDVVVIERRPLRLSGGFGHRSRDLRGKGWKRGDIVVVKPSGPAGSWETGLHGEGAPTGRLVKRIVAMPGETVDVYGGTLLVNGVPEAEPTTLLDVWTLMTSASLRTADLYAMGIRDVRKTPGGYVVGPASRAQIASIRSHSTIDRAARCISCTPARGRWQVPRRGVPVVPDGREDAEKLARMIRVHEGRAATVTTGGSLMVDHAVVNAYAFQDDYVFVAGDNRSESVDSRSWGPVPVSLINGRVVRIVASWSHRARELRPGRLWSRPEKSFAGPSLGWSPKVSPTMQGVLRRKASGLAHLLSRAATSVPGWREPGKRPAVRR